jgi:polyhydroxybutyrate depolymerase
MRRRVPCLIVLLALLAFAVAACGGAADAEGPGGAEERVGAADESVPAPAVEGVEGGTTVEAQHELEVDGMDRRYLTYAPAALPIEHVPVVVFLHGGVGSGVQLAESAEVREHADVDGYLAVLPDGTTNDEGRFRTWNGGRCCGPAVANDVDDVGFLEAVLDDVAAQWDVDPDRVFVAGHSNGGIMANRLACELPDRVAAIGVVAGSLEVPCDEGMPTSVLYVHGDADTNHPIEGGAGEDSIAGVEFTSVSDSLATWVEVDGCDPVGEEDLGAEISTTRWTGCDDGTEVQLQVVHGAPHAWPGGSAGRPGATPPSGVLDATAALWDFFEEHPRR